MPISKDKKKELVKELEAVLKGSKGAVFVGFKGLKVNDATKMRKTFRAQNVNYVVAKKTLLNRALDAADISGSKPEIAAEVAVAYANDNLAPAREVGNFSRQNKGMLSIIGGIFEGRFITSDEVKSYSLIPDRQTLYAQVVNLFNSPIRGFVVAVSEIAKKKQA